MLFAVEKHWGFCSSSVVLVPSGTIGVMEHKRPETRTFPYSSGNVTIKEWVGAITSFASIVNTTERLPLVLMYTFFIRTSSVPRWSAYEGFAISTASACSI